MKNAGFSPPNPNSIITILAERKEVKLERGKTDRDKCGRKEKRGASRRKRCGGKKEKRHSSFFQGSDHSKWEGGRKRKKEFKEIRRRRQEKGWREGQR